MNLFIGRVIFNISLENRWTMKRWLILLITLVMVTAMAPGARSEVFLDYDFPEGVVWQIGGFEVYDIMVRGEPVGTSRIEYSTMEMANEEAYRVEWFQEWTSGENETTTIDIDVKMRASDLKAHMARRTYTVGENEWRFEGNYTGNNLEFLSYYPGEETANQASIMRSTKFHDADLVPFILRNIPFVDGNIVTFSVIDVAQHSFVTPIPRIVGSEIVETTNTQYDCWIVNWSVGMESYTAWYSKNEKHYLVKVRYSDREIVLNHHS